MDVRDWMEDFKFMIRPDTSTMVYAAFLCDPNGAISEFIYIYGLMYYYSVQCALLHA